MITWVKAQLILTPTKVAMVATISYNDLSTFTKTPLFITTSKVEIFTPQ